MPQQPTPNDPQDGDEDDGSVFRSRFALWIYLAIFLALVVHLVLNWTGTDAATIEYSTFLDYVESGYVERIEVVDDARINGTYTRAALEGGHVKRSSRDDGGLLGGVAAADKRAFRTTKPSDHELTALLRAHNKKVAAGEASTRVHFSAETGNDWINTLLFWLVPLALLVLVWIFFLRRMNPGSQMLNIGKNTATLFEA